MSSINLNGKRRRVESATSALSKPFKSPLRRPPQVAGTQHDAKPKEENNAPPNPSLNQQTVDRRNQPVASTSASLSPDKTSTPSPLSLESRKRRADSNHLTPSKKPIFSDPVILDLQKQQRALQSRLATLRSELDTAQQALRLESSAKDAELQSLIMKWRSVSQNAAEEVFAGAQERVARMGGMKGWRERMKNSNAPWGQEEMESWYGSAEAEGVDIDEGELEARKAEMVEVCRKSHDGDRESKDTEDEEFTMEYMLKTLNIDLKVIGRRGAECLPAKSCKEGEKVTVPAKYLRDLEARIAELEHGSRTSMTAPQARDIGIQTEPRDVLPCDCPHINNDNDDNTSLALSDFLDFDPQRKSPDSSRQAITMAPDQLLNQVKSSESHLISFPSSRLQMPSLSDFINPRSSDGLCLMDTGVDNPKPTDVESLHDLAMVGGYSFWLEEAYANLYFSISHFVWPLLDCNAWSSWRHDWNLDKQTELWKGFFVQMVYAIGSLSCSILQPGQNHSDRAAEIYTSALSYYPHVMAEESAVLRLQASILMILYSLHCPSSGEISMSVSSIVPFCSATLAELQKRISSGCDSTTRSVVGPHIPLTESMFITCYMLNEIIVSGWERPVSEAYRIVDDDIHTLSNEIPDASSTSAALRHLFRLRKIQANIRRYWDGPPDYQDSDDTSFKLALDAWRKDIPRYSVEDARSTHLHPLWMTNLYDYSVIILMQGKRNNLEHEEIDAILSAGIEVCLNYRRMQEEGQVMCFTWSTVHVHMRACLPSPGR
ncbi:hypothetical protein BDV23DRAFT_191943 [Aspergillus alliaceus]|uniref:Uncharacterized protein n=1 Tax=Petromyces alliaceus TaxID=209559 RepID=A0A5N7BQR9_PETAA|nr:hypothetical protein BDV23DRAFT_191943 [Aspergillus alliaceus]